MNQQLMWNLPCPVIIPEDHRDPSKLSNSTCHFIPDDQAWMCVEPETIGLPCQSHLDITPLKRNNYYMSFELD